MVLFQLYKQLFCSTRGNIAVTSGGEQCKTLSLCLNLWVHSSLNNYIGKEFNFPPLISFFMTVFPRKGKNIITECSNTLTKKYRLLAYRQTLGVNCEWFFLLIIIFFFGPLSRRRFSLLSCNVTKVLFKKKGITLPLSQSLEFTFVLRENTKKAVSLADQQWHNEEEALCVHAFIPRAKEFKHRVLSFIRNAHLFHISECLNVYRRCIAANACLPILQPATILGRQVGTGVGSHGSSFGRPACHRGA